MSVAAARCSATDTCFSFASSPTICGAPRRCASSSRRIRFSVASRRCASARSTISSRCSGSTGFARKSRAPSFIAATASWMLPNAVITMTGSCGSKSFDGAQHAEAVALGQPEIRQDHGGMAREQRGFRFALVARLDDGVALRFERMAQHRPQRVLVFDDEDRGSTECRERALIARRSGEAGEAERSPQPAGREHRRGALLPRSRQAPFLPAAISCWRRPRSPTAFRRSRSMTARCAGSSRFTKSVASELMRV